MKCFTHRDVDALGVCKQCGKALCENCLAVSETGIYCRGACALSGPLRSQAAPANRGIIILQAFAVCLTLLACYFFYIGATAVLDFDLDEPGPSPFPVLVVAVGLFTLASVCFGVSRLWRRVQ